MIIGITGSFGSGKTTIANLFKKYNFKIINVDRLYKDIHEKNKPLKNKIKKEFGTINRAELKNIVFKNSKRLKKLNKITHPLILKEIKKALKKLKNKNILIDIPLLIEANATNLVDKIIVVKCKQETQIKRILKKKKYTKEDINNIIKSQMPLKEKIKYADFVIDNDNSINKTKNQVNRIINTLKI